MIKGVGVDIVANNRFISFPKGALEKIFTEYELKKMEERVCKEEYLSSRFAVKEAVVKALGTGFRGIGPKDIETVEDDCGRPAVRIRGEVRHSFHLSLSHEKEYSVAFVVLEEM